MGWTILNVKLEDCKELEMVHYKCCYSQFLSMQKIIAKLNIAQWSRIVWQKSCTVNSAAWLPALLPVRIYLTKQLPQNFVT